MFSKSLIIPSYFVVKIQQFKEIKYFKNIYLIMGQESSISPLIINNVYIYKGIKMKKILTIISVISLMSFNSNALEVSDMSVTAGVSINSAVYGASAKETNRAENNSIKTVKNESGVFTDTHTSGFIELNAGEFVSLGFEHTPDSISTPTNDRVSAANNTTTVSVDFNDVNIAYLKVNMPGGVYVKAGYVTTDLDIKESMAAGGTSGTSSSYANVDTNGTLLGLGYVKPIGENGIALRIEGSYMALDDVSTNNGVSPTGGTIANGGRNQVDASSMEGLNGKIALTYTFGQ